MSRSARKKKYKLRNFVIDVGMTILTGGFWLIWVFVREMRRK